MPLKEQAHNNEKARSKLRLPNPASEKRLISARQQAHPAAIVQRAGLDSRSLPPGDVLQLQRTIGNRAVQRLLTQKDKPQSEPRSAPHHLIQAKLNVGSANDSYEQEADRVAAQVVSQINTPQGQPADTEQSVQRQELSQEEGEELKRKPLIQLQPLKDGLNVSADVERSIQTSRGSGQPIAENVRASMENSFGADFSGVKVHTDTEADRLNRSVQAQAFTTGHDIFFRQGEYNPGSLAGQHLLAHELTHVVQQSGSGAGGGNKASSKAEADVAANATLRGSDAPRLSASSSCVQRRVEMRGVGRGEASGLPRLQELIDRLNTISTALIFMVNGTVLTFVENPYGTQTEFDRQMMAFIGDARVLPLRLTTREALQGDRATGFNTPVDVDSYTFGYVDIDDLLVSSDLGLQTSLVHLLRERAETRNYERRIGIITGSAALLPNAEFDRSHARGIESELALLRDFFGDPGIRIIDADQRLFRSTRGDSIRETQRRGRGRAESGVLAISWEVRLRDGRRMTPEQYRDLLAAERAAAAPVAAPAAPAPVAPR